MSGIRRDLSRLKVIPVVPDGLSKLDILIRKHNEVVGYLEQLGIGTGEATQVNAMVATDHTEATKPVKSGQPTSGDSPND